MNLSGIISLILISYTKLSLANINQVEDGYFVSGKEKSKCGHEDVFCKHGIKTKVIAGYYSIGGGKDGNTRNAQRICDVGHYW